MMRMGSLFDPLNDYRGCANLIRRHL